MVVDKRRLARAFVVVLTLLISSGSPWAGCLRVDADPALGAHAGHAPPAHCEDRAAHGTRSSCASACSACAAGPSLDTALAKVEIPVTDFLPLLSGAAPLHRWPVVKAAPALPRGGGLLLPAVTLFALRMLLLD